MYCALCEATARTSESPGRLHRFAPYKGQYPLRRFAAIPAPEEELNIVPFDRFTLTGKVVFFILKIQN